MEGLFSRLSLEGKVALLIGASKGMGEGMALAFARAGARVVGCSRKEADIRKTMERIRAAGGEALAVSGNASSAEDRRKMIQAAMEWGGRIDILVNNAGANPYYGPSAGLPESAWDKTFEVNVKAAFFMSQLVFQTWMMDHGGVILNMASVAGFKTSAGVLAYNVSKAALVHLTKCLAGEWGPLGIRVNALAPGFIRTEFSRAVWDSPKWEKMVKNYPLARIGEVEDVTQAALFLASDASSYITGQAMVIDGGDLVKVDKRD
jgi:NAD(P)-dependent dehydrogenase (short-subunit alcohol dehydrogenase family)